MSDFIMPNQCSYTLIYQKLQQSLNMIATYESTPKTKQLIKVYIRLNDKRAFPINIQTPTLLSQLKLVIVEKTKIDKENLIVIYSSNKIDFQQQKTTQEKIILKNNTIVHAIDKRNIHADILQLTVRFIQKSNTKNYLTQSKFITKPKEIIKTFKEDQLMPIVQKIINSKVLSKDITLLSKGKILQDNLNFQFYFVQNNSQIICLFKENQLIEPQSAIFRMSNSEFDSKLEKLKKVENQTQNRQGINFSSQSLKFVKLQRFQSKPQIGKMSELQVQKQDNFKMQSNSKLRKMQRITSDIAKEFQSSTLYQNKNDQNKVNLQENYIEESNNSSNKIKLGDFLILSKPLRQSKSIQFNRIAQKFSKLMNRNVLDNWYDEPDSPIEVEYPKIQPKNIVVQQQQENLPLFNSAPPQKVDKFQFLQNISGRFQAAVQKKEEKYIILQKKKISKLQQKAQNSSIIVKGDFILITTLNKKYINLNKNDKNINLEQLSRRFDVFLSKKFQGEASSIIEVQYPKIQKRVIPKEGDFILYGQKMENMSNKILPEINQKFNKLFKVLNQKRRQQFHSQDEFNKQNKENEHKNNQNQKYTSQYLKNDEKEVQSTQMLKTQRLQSQVQHNNTIKLGDQLIIRSIDFRRPKSKLIQTIASKYSRLTVI